jgi:hypothetical protein
LFSTFREWLTWKSREKNIMGWNSHDFVICILRDVDCWAKGPIMFVNLTGMFINVAGVRRGPAKSMPNGMEAPNTGK